MKTVNISSHKVECNESLVTGSDNIIFGNNNKIAGDNNKIYGNNNAVVGNGNVLKGENNSASGSNNELLQPFGSFGPPSSSAFATSPSFNSAPNFFTQSINEAFSTQGAPSTNNDMYFQPIQMPQPSYAPYQPPVSPVPYPVSPVPFSSRERSNSNGMYFQPVQPAVAMAPTLLAPQPVTAFLMVSPPSPAPGYVNPFSPPSSPTPFGSASPNPFEKEKKEKVVDIIQDGTLVLIVNESESEYVREFCKLISTNSGQKVGCHISAGRMCIVGLGDLAKIRDAIIQQLPLLNLKLKDWSWNTFGKNVCSDKDVYYKRLFKEYTREDVDCWRDKPTKIAA